MKTTPPISPLPAENAMKGDTVVLCTVSVTLSTMITCKKKLAPITSAPAGARPSGEAIIAMSMPSTPTGRTRRYSLSMESESCVPFSNRRAARLR